MPVQCFLPLSVTQTDKRPGQAAAGAGQAGQVVKQADRRQVRDPATRIGPWQQHAGHENEAEQKPDSGSA